MEESAPDSPSNFTLVKYQKVPARGLSRSVSSQVYIAARPGETVKELNARLQERLQISASRQLLSHKTTQLWAEDRKRENGERLRDCRWDEFGVPAGAGLALTHYSSLGTGAVAQIPNTASRAITVAQLRRVHDFVKEQGDETGRFFHWCDLRDGTQLSYSSMNLYHLADWVIRPATFHDKCSLVELVAEQAQQPDWFASHWWGEPIVQFLDCLTEHCSIRSMNEDTTAYWICAFANNQHELGAEIATDPTKTSFFRAMQASRGVLCILDESGFVFTRSWCTFETATAMKQPRILLDIATAFEWSETEVMQSTRMQKTHMAVIVTEGLTREELQDNRDNPGSGMTKKAKREKHFPLELVSRGLTIDVKCSEASVALDRKRILNTLAGRRDSLDEEPLDEHPNYEHVNNRLRAVFALAGWQSAVQSKPDLLLRFSSAVKADIDRQIFRLNVAGCYSFNDARLCEVSLALHAGLKAVELNMYLCKGLTNFGLTSLAERLPQSLQTLDLAVNFIRSVGNEGVMALARHLPRSLRNLSLACSGTDSTDSALEAIADYLPESLLNLQLYFSRCRSVTDYGFQYLVGELPAGLRTLTLRFEGCSGITRGSVDRLRERLPDLIDLRTLDTNFYHTKVPGDAIASLHSWRPSQGAMHMRLQDHDSLAQKLGSEKVAEELQVVEQLLHGRNMQVESHKVLYKAPTTPDEMTLTTSFDTGRRAAGDPTDVQSATKLADRGRRQANSSARSEVLSIFQRWDLNGDGMISKEELGACLKHLDENLTDENIASTFALVDMNLDGKVDIEEFVSWIFE